MHYLLDHPNPHGPHFHTTRREPIRLIVLHTAENAPDYTPPDTGAEAVARYASVTDRRVSWHVTIDSDSTIPMLPDEYTAFHVRGYNSISLGLEMATRAEEWYGSPDEWRYPLLYRVIDQLAEWCQTHQIPPVYVTKSQVDAGRRGITGHAELDPTRRSDPGHAFPFTWVLDEVARKVEVGDEIGHVTILGNPTASLRQMQAWASSRDGTQRFVELAADCYEHAMHLGVDPAVPYAVMAHETAFGHFGGVLGPDHHNWGGIKTAAGGDNYDPQAHQRFPTDGIGVLAVVQHVALYAGVHIHPDRVVDPRHFPSLRGKATRLPSDGWTWAGSSHGPKVAAYVKEMRNG